MWIELRMLQIPPSSWSCLIPKVRPGYMWRAFRSWPRKRDQATQKAALIATRAAATYKTKDTATGQSS